MRQQPAWVVEFYTDARGNSPVLEFIDELEKSLQAKVLRDLRRVREFGPSGAFAAPIKGKIWEFKIDQSRLFYFAYTGRRVVILHGYLKKSQRAPRREIETAQRRMADLEEGKGATQTYQSGGMGS